MQSFFDYHRGKNDVSVEQHIRNKQIGLTKGIEGQIAIYLDTKFWILLCEASLDRSDCDLDYELLSLVLESNDQRIAFFPISEATYAELTKQNNQITRKATSNLIDRLSNGIALLPHDLRIKTEIAHVIHSAFEPNSVYALKELVWTKVINVLGPMYPINTGFDPETELLIQKAFFDHLWELTLTEMTTKDTHPSSSFDTLANFLNANNEKYSNELRSYEQAYLNEISGVLDLFSDDVTSIINEMALRRDIQPQADSETGKKVINIFREAYRKNTINQAAPSLDIFARCHAAVRWNKGRKINSNDIFDFYHASAALGYCDAFFTERSLCNLLTEKKTCLDEVHQCKVLYKQSDAIAYLRTLLT